MLLTLDDVRSFRELDAKDVASMSAEVAESIADGQFRVPSMEEVSEVHARLTASVA